MFPSFIRLEKISTAYNSYLDFHRWPLRHGKEDYANLVKTQLYILECLLSLFTKLLSFHRKNKIAIGLLYLNCFRPKWF